MTLGPQDDILPHAESECKPGGQSYHAPAACAIDAGSRTEGSGDISEVGSKASIRIRELRRVGHIERIRPELRLHPFTDIDPAREAEVQSEKPRSVEYIPSRVSLNVVRRSALGEARGTEPGILSVLLCLPAAKTAGVPDAARPNSTN
jgi:hypothetical protein